MITLVEYVHACAIRGACTCGRCCDSGPEPEKHQPNGHTADVYFFQVAATQDADADTLCRLIGEHKGTFNECDPLDRCEHSYIELGGWIGDQSLALMLMGLGTVLGLWRMLTPKMLPGLDKGLMDQMAGQGMVSIGRIPTAEESKELKKAVVETRGRKVI